MPLISLDESNRAKCAIYEKHNSNLPRRNGIACPKCGEELIDSNPMVILTSYPPQLNVHCPNCNYTGYRIK